MTKLDGKVAMVTGGGSGIGRAGAAAMAAAGARVLIAEIDAERGEAVAKSIRDQGGEATASTVDVTTAVERWGSLDVLFHNAVDVHFVNNFDGRLTEISDETWTRIVDLVLSGTFRCCRHAGRQMIAQGSGSIVLTATTDALIGCAGLDADASRASVDALHLLPIPSPEEIAPLVVHLASDDSRAMTGAVIPIDSGYMAFKANLDIVGAMRVDDDEAAS